MSDALDRVIARANARTAAMPAQAPVNPPPAPPVAPAPSQDQVDVTTQLQDCQDAISDLADRVTVLEQAATTDALSDLNAWADAGAMSASIKEGPLSAAVAEYLDGKIDTVAAVVYTAAAFDTADRKKLADTGAAMKDGSYPIRNQSDLENAVQSLGRAKNLDAVKAHIKKRAAALKLTPWLEEHAPSVVGADA